MIHFAFIHCFKHERWMFNDPVQEQTLTNFSFESSSRQTRQVFSFSVSWLFGSIESSAKVTYQLNPSFNCSSSVRSPSSSSFEILRVHFTVFLSIISVSFTLENVWPSILSSLTSNFTHPSLIISPYRILYWLHFELFMPPFHKECHSTRWSSSFSLYCLIS